MKRAVLFVAAIGLAATPTLAQNMRSGGGPSNQTMTKSQSNKNTATLDQFVKNAAVGNMFEIQSSQLALQRSQRQDVRTVAQHLVDDHNKAASDLKTALGSNGPQPPQSLDAKHQQMLTKLQNAQGSNFDKVFITEQQQAHREAISLFKRYSQSGDNAQVKQFAQSTLPTLEQHLTSVQDLQRASNATASGDMKSNSGGGGSATRKSR